EWWKDKKEKALGQYLVRPGAPVRPPELLDYGIIPFELNLIRYKNRELKPGEGPPITNMTTSLQVVKLEKFFGTQYQMTLKNTSAKRVIYFRVESAAAGIGSAAAPVATNGAIPDDNLVVRGLAAQSVDRDGIRISSVVFDDGTFEGDPLE